MKKKKKKRRNVENSLAQNVKHHSICSLSSLQTHQNFFRAIWFWVFKIEGIQVFGGKPSKDNSAKEHVLKSQKKEDFSFGTMREK